MRARPTIWTRRAAPPGALLGILNDTLDFSKIEAGKMALDPQPFLLDTLLRDLGVMLGPAQADKPVELLFDLAPEVPRQLLGDALRLQQVLVNLLGNALKFTAQGEVVLRINCEQREGQRVKLGFEVRDTGIGISPEQQARLFQGFTQADAGITRRFGGTGLGLAISQRLVALMGGELSLRSRLGEGSRFAFSLWLPSLPAPARDARSLHLLVVDDHAATRAALARLALTLGWRAVPADSGAQGLARLDEAAQAGDPFDAVLVDEGMPGLDGFETAARIRQAGRPPRLVLMLGAQDRGQSSEAPPGAPLFDALLVKPVTASMLFDAFVGAVQTQPAGPGTARLRGLRLLLVEDNLVNQQVAQELLSAEGASVQLAGNGQLALDWLGREAASFDAVLMDLQMPVLDGLSATRRIRGELGLTRLPIVAMTANASSADRQACLEAGMNDHVGKPFELDRLVATLLRCTRGAAPAPVSPVSPVGRSARSARSARSSTPRRPAGCSCRRRWRAWAVRARSMHACSRASWPSCRGNWQAGRTTTARRAGAACTPSRA
jgi:two-component system sensor histidine kinase/response regulator